MPSLMRHPVARFVVTTALVGSLTDWVLFATLVVTVDALIGGGPWATALVLLVRIVPSVLFAPIAARRVDRADLQSTLGRHEALRVGAVLALAAGFAVRSVPAILVGLLALEFAAAMQAAAREAMISRHVPRATFTALNTATAVLAYGMLPVGPVIVGLVGSTTGWALAVAGYTALTLAYRMGLRLDEPIAHTEPVPWVGTTPAAAAVPVAPAAATSWRRVTVAAALGVLPAVALFALGPSFAGAWLGDRSATGALYALVLGGGAVGFVLANRRGFRADVAMLVASAGLLVAVTGLWAPGLALLGLGAGAAYLDLQTRLQHAAADPSEFAAAFAILKVASAAAVAGAPALAAVGPLSSVLVVGALAALAGAVVAAPAPGVVAQRAVRTVLEGVARVVVRVEVVDADHRVAGPAVVVSNHPHWLDGVVVLLADRSLRPVARRQDHVVARVGIWAAGAVVTTTPAGPHPVMPGADRRPAFAEAASHLSGGGRVWLAPEGGAHTERVLRTPRSGAVRMAHLAGVPIQPLAIGWADDPAGPQLSRWRPWRRRIARLTWGAPMTTAGDVAIDNAAMMAALGRTAGMATSTPVDVAA